MGLNRVNHWRSYSTHVLCHLSGGPDLLGSESNYCCLAHFVTHLPPLVHYFILILLVCFSLVWLVGLNVQPRSRGSHCQGLAPSGPSSTPVAPIVTNVPSLPSTTVASTSIMVDSLLSSITGAVESQFAAMLEKSLAADTGHPLLPGSTLGSMPASLSSPGQLFILDECKTLLGRAFAMSE